MLHWNHPRVFLGAMTSTSIDHLETMTKEGTLVYSILVKVINMGVDSKVQELLVSPPSVGHTPHTTISEDDAKMVKAVEEHFGKEGYELPVKEDATEMAGLTEREMMFLVCQLAH
jgi:hypothetical protein